MILMTGQHWRWLGLACLAVFSSPSTLLAHDDGSVLGGFPSGFWHPISGLDHVLAMIAVGLWGAQLGSPQVWLLPLTFPLMMAVGAAMGLIGYPLPAVEQGIASSALVLGLMVIFSARPPVAVSLLLVGVFALFHGHAHGTELPVGASSLWYSVGFVIGTGLLHATGIGFGTLQRWPWGKSCLRGAGLVVVAGGIYFLLNSLGWFA